MWTGMGTHFMGPGVNGDGPMGMTGKGGWNGDHISSACKCLAECDGCRLKLQV